MGVSDNLPTFDQWNFRSSASTDHPWNSESFKSHETEAFTKALQQSMISRASISHTTTTPTTTITNDHDHHQHPYLMIIKPDSSPIMSGSDRNPMMRSNGKIAKRKPRATSYKATHNTTFITADPSNFRQMVQQVTGVRLGQNNNNNNNNLHVPAAGNHQVLKPEPQRAYLSSCHNHLLEPATGSRASTTQLAHDFSAEPVMLQGDVVLGFDTFQSYPTLESWRLM